MSVLVDRVLVVVDRMLRTLRAGDFVEKAKRKTHEKEGGTAESVLVDRVLVVVDRMLRTRRAGEDVGLQERLEQGLLKGLYDLAGLDAKNLLAFGRQSLEQALEEAPRRELG